MIIIGFIPGESASIMTAEGVNRHGSDAPRATCIIRKHGKQRAIVDG